MGVGGKSGGGDLGAADDDLDQYGRGEYFPETDSWEWYEVPEERDPTRPRLTWADLLAQWPLIESDLLDRQIDVESGVLDARSARWIRAAISGLLLTESRLQRHFAPPPPKSQGG